MDSDLDETFTFILIIKALADGTSTKNSKADIDILLYSLNKKQFFMKQTNLNCKRFN